MGKNVYKVDAVLIDPSNDCEEYNSYGFISAETYTDAVSQAITYYGEDDVVSIKVEYVSDIPFVEITDEEMAKAIAKELV